MLWEKETLWTVNNTVNRLNGVASTNKLPTMKDVYKNIRNTDWNKFTWFKELGISLENKNTTLKTLDRAHSIISDFLKNQEYEDDLIAPLDSLMEALHMNNDANSVYCWAVSVMDEMARLFNLVDCLWFRIFIKEATR
ncbi:hypothetical protein [Mycoplasma sp. Z1473D]